MPIGMTEDQRALAAAIREWAARLDTPALAKASETEGVAAWTGVARGLAELGVAGIAVPESHGGAGGSFVDLATAVEACAAAMVPGAVLPTAAVATLLAEQADSPSAKALLPGIADGTATVALALSADLTLSAGHVSGRTGPALGAGVATHLLAPYDVDRWLLVDLAGPGAAVEPGLELDLAGRVGAVVLDEVAVGPDATLELPTAHVRAVLATLAAAEASGIAGWSLETAVAYAKVREQFGRPIGSFQSVKHLCAEMLEAAESAAAVAWDAATAYGGSADDAQFTVAATVAGVVGLDLGVTTAQTCIQVLGGIGFTWEHHAHLYLRRATSTRQLLGGTDTWARELADLALAGARRHPHVDPGPAGEQTRATVRAELAAVAALPVADQRAVLAETGLLMPHWPAPYGRDASPAEQLVIDEEYEAAGVARPSLGIGAWAAPTIVVHGSDAQRERFLGPTLRGELVWCQLFSEPGAGSDLASLRTRAERTEGGWVLTGQKVWTSLAATADWGICLARTDPDAPSHRGITYFLVDMRSPGLEIRPLRELTGEALFNEVFLDGVVVPDECVVGAVDGGWPLARNTLANERVAISDSSFGVSVERALRTVASRGAGDADRLRVGHAVGAAGTVKALGTRATLRSLSGQGPGPESSVLKLVGVRQRQESAELALDLLGPDLLLGTGEAGPALAEVLVTRCLSIAGGTTQVLRNVAAERILGLPRD